MVKGPTPPKSLVETQEWMSKAVRVPYTEKSNTLLKKSSTYLTQTSTLGAKERLEIYINDYWPRCIESLQDDLPLLYAFWGEEKFEKIVINYLTNHPSNSHSLYNLGDQLSTFIQTHYEEEDKAFIQNLIAYEWTLAQQFTAGKEPPFNPEQLSEDQKKHIQSIEIRLQPHLALLECVAHFLAWKPKHHKLPKLRPIHLVIFQNDEGQLREEVIPKAFYIFLSCLKKGYTLDNAIELLIPELEQNKLTVSDKALQEWISICIQKKWLCHPAQNSTKKRKKS